MTYGELLRDKIDADYAAKHGEDGMRTHLGASVIGDKCMRAIWFSFRWCDAEEFSGRILRLFDRGHEEEKSFNDLLREAGAIVYDLDPATGKQIRIEAWGGHFGGSSDGVATNLPDFPNLPAIGNIPVLLEEKTHNEKWFKQLLAKGMRDTKPEHYRQSQVYMHLLNLKGWIVTKALYCAVNKNDDELHFELFDYDPQIGIALLERAEAIIFHGMPARISENPSWFECRFCAFKGICFKFKQARFNCRTCRFSKPNRDGTWSCTNGRTEISTQPKQGCGEHQYMTELL